MPYNGGMMFTLPHNTIARLYKQPVGMRLSMFRLQGLISSSRHSFARGDFHLFTNRPRTLTGRTAAAAGS